MNELQKRLLLLGGGATRYGTAGTTTQTTLASQGGLLINIDSATGDIARTTNGWIEDEKYGFYAVNFANNTSFEFDSAVTRTGRLTLKLSTTDATGRAMVLTAPQLNFGSATTNLANSKYFIPCKVNTKYRLYCYVKTNNVAAISSFFDIYTIASTGTSTFINTTNTLSGTNDWTLLRLEFTTGASAAWIGYAMYLNVAGNISDAWFDVNSMTLEEVVEPVAHTFDQTFTTGTASGASTGNIAGTSYMSSQSFTPAISQHSGVVLYKKANTGTPTGNFKVDLRTDNAGSPSNTILATTTISLSEYNLIPVGEFVVNLGASLTIGTKYHYVFTDTVTEASGNAFTLGGHAAGGYAGGDSRYSTNGGTSWLVNGTLDLYFKSFYSPLNTPSPSLVSFTAVGSTDNIDQSQLASSGSVSFSNIAQYQAQQFTPTKSLFTSVTLYKKVSSGSPSGTMTFQVVNDNADNPGTTVYATLTMSNATYVALANNAEFTVNLPCTLSANGTTKYWLKISYSVSSATDFPVLGAIGPASSYTGGLYKYGTDGVTYGTTFNGDAYFKTLYYKPTTNFKASQNNLSVSISADEDGFLNGSVINLQTGTATFTETFGTFYLLQYTISGSDLIAEINLPGVGLSASFTSDRTLEYSSDGVTYGSTFPTGVTKVWVKILAYSGFASFSYSIQFSTSGLSILKNYPTNKDIIKQYSTTLGAATTTATYRATKWGFPAIEYSSTEYQYLDVDTTATGSTVAFSELGTSYTTVADGASLAISSTSTPNIFVKANITANRLYLSSNDYNASSDKDGSMKETVVYQVVQ